MSPLAGRLRADFPIFTPAQMFALATDIESYPSFLPWCRHARIVARDPAGWLVENHFGAGPLDAGFRTRAMLDPPHRLEIVTDEPPFKQFRLVWSFASLPPAGCRVTLEYVADLRAPLLQTLARLAAPEMEHQILRRFRDRARLLYGSRNTGPRP